MTPFDFAAARENMVENEIRTNDVTDRALIAAFREVPREAFLPEGRASLAYGSNVQTLENGRFLLDPRCFAKLIQAAGVRPGDLVLDLGAASGYSTAVLSRMCDTVVGVESDESLVAKASDALQTVGADNAAVIHGELKAGAPSQGPFDVIVIEGAVPEVPKALFDQLADGGRLVAVECDGPIGRAMVYERAGDVTSGRCVFDAKVPYLPGFEPEPTFQF